jgi:hypothetical protein
MTSASATRDPGIDARAAADPTGGMDAAETASPAIDPGMANAAVTAGAVRVARAPSPKCAPKTS